MRTFLLRIAEHLAGVWYWIRGEAGASVDASQINAQLWAGGAVTTDADVAQLAAWGITADVDCREEFDDRSLIDGYNNLPPTPSSLKTHPAISYLYDPAVDDGQPKPVQWFADAWTFAKPVLEQGGVVLCHCAAGHNRGPSMAYFLLRAHTKLAPADALALIKAKRPVATLAYAPDADRAIAALRLATKESA